MSAVGEETMQRGGDDSIPKKRPVQDEDEELAVTGNGRDGSDRTTKKPKRENIDDIHGPDLARNEIITRMLLTPTEMARVIGRGGEYINKVRASSGATIKACDVENNEKVAVIYGEPGRVGMAFELLLEKVAGPRSDVNSVRLLVSNDEAGRIVGARGVNILELRVSGGAESVQIEKQVTALGRMNLRVMTVEGSTKAIAHVHAGYHRLFHAHVPFPGEPAGGGRGRDRERERDWGPGQGPGQGLGHGHGHKPHPQDYERDTPHYVNSSYPGPAPIHVPVPSPATKFLSAETVVQRGVPAETVQQLQLMKIYLRENFKISLQYVDEVPVPPSPASAQFEDWRSHDNSQYQRNDQNMNMQNERNSFPRAPPAGHSAPIDDRRNAPPARDAPSGHAQQPAVPINVRFAVPASICGGLIGRGGENIHTMGKEFHVHIDINKTVHPVDNTRDVIVNPLDARDANAERNIQGCKHRMMQMVQQLLASGGL